VRVEQEIEQQDHTDRGDQREQRHDADRNIAAEMDRSGFDRAKPQPPAVGGKGFEQPILDDDGQAERHQQRRQQIASQGAVEQHLLQGKTCGEHRRHGQQRREERIEPEPRHQRQDRERRQHDQVAMGEIDQPHDAEDQRQAGGEQRVQAAEQNALKDAAKPVDHAQRPK